MICSKDMFTINVSAVMLSDATFPSPRAQKRLFCALFAFGTPVFGRFEHKIEVFVRGGVVMLVVFGDLSMNCGT